MEIIFYSISSLLLLVIQVKTKESSKKMQLQEVIQKIKTQIKISIKNFQQKLFKVRHRYVYAVNLVDDFIANNEKQINNS